MEYLKGLFGNRYFTDDKGRKIYYRSVNQTAYLIKPEQEKQLFLYRNRISVTVFILAFLATLQAQWYFIVFGGMVAFLYLEYRFHFVFLKKLTQYPNYSYETQKKKVIAEVNSKNDKLVTLLYGFLIIVMMIYMFLAQRIEIIIAGVLVIGYSFFRVYTSFVNKS